MEERKKTEKVEQEKHSCADKLCPVHGSNPVKLRGRVFEGNVIKKFLKRIVIQFERNFYILKHLK